MDSFEAATQFALILRGLTPSIQLLVKAAHFALKNSESEDYLFSSIISTLSDSSIELNTKSTIFQFIEILINESVHFKSTSPNKPYLSILKSSLPKILSLVLPSTNNSNLYNVFLSLKNISRLLGEDCTQYISKYNSNLLTSQDLIDIGNNLEFQSNSEPERGDPIATAWLFLLDKKRQSQYERMRLLKNSKILDAAPEDTIDENQIFNLKEKDHKKLNLLTKKQILMRMEDDREAHKRSKENLWVVSRPKSSKFVSEEEFAEHYWTTSTGLSKLENDTLMDSLDELNKYVNASFKDPQF